MASKSTLIAAVLVAAFIVVAAVVVLNPGIYNLDDNDKETKAVGDVYGREVEIRTPLENIVLPASDSFRAYVAVAGDDWLDLLAGGLGDFETNGRSYYDAFCEIEPRLKDLPDIGNAWVGGPDIEKTLELNPDLLILDKSAKEYEFLKGDYEKALNDAGMPYVFIDFYMDPYGKVEDGTYNYVQSMSILGEVLGKEDRAKDISNYFEDKMREIVPSIPKEGRTVYMEFMYGPEAIEYMTTNFGEPEIGFMNGRNIAAEWVAGANGVPTNFEGVHSKDPDVIVLAYSTYFNADPSQQLFGYGMESTDEELAELMAKYVGRVGWKELTAVKNKDVHMMYAQFRATLEAIMNVQYMAMWPYPDVYGDLTPEEDLEEMYDLFMPIEFKGVWSYKFV